MVVSTRRGTSGLAEKGMLKVVLKSAQDFAMKSWERELPEGEWRGIRKRKWGGVEEGKRARRRRRGREERR